MNQISTHTIWYWYLPIKSLGTDLRGNPEILKIDSYVWQIQKNLCQEDEDTSSPKYHNSRKYYNIMQPKGW